MEKQGSGDTIELIDFDDTASLSAAAEEVADLDIVGRDTVGSAAAVAESEMFSGEVSVDTMMLIEYAEEIEQAVGVQESVGESAAAGGDTLPMLDLSDTGVLEGLQLAGEDERTPGAAERVGVRASDTEMDGRVAVAAAGVRNNVDETAEEFAGELTDESAAREIEDGEFIALEEEEAETAASSEGRKKEVKKEEKTKRGRSVGRKRILLAIAAAAAIAALAVGLLLSRAAARRDAQARQLYALGERISQIGVTGESGLLAVADAQLAAQLAAQEAEAEAAAAVTETQLVDISFTSVEQDIKIKFVQHGTERLVSGVPFEIVLADSSGNESSYIDRDTDGVIYETGLSGGDYTAAVVPIEGYEFSPIENPVQIRDRIVYERINVAEEIRSEAEVNVAAEDTAANVAAEEPEEVVPVTPTPPVVEEPDGYQRIEKESIPEPSYAWAEYREVASVFLAGSYYAQQRQTLRRGVTALRTEESAGGEDTASEAAEENTSSGSDSADSGTEAAQGGDADGSSANDSDSETGSGANGGSETGSGANGGGGSSENNGNSENSDRGNDGGSQNAQSKEPEKEDDTPTVTRIRVDAEQLSLPVDTISRINASAELSDGSSVTEGLRYRSEDEGIATVNDSGEVRGIAAGTVKIIVSYRDSAGNTKEETVRATVTAREDTRDPRSDTQTRLRDRNGRQVYIRSSSGDYVAAVYADYYTASAFYIATGEAVEEPAAEPTQTMGGAVLGIDVSKWNGSINWTAVKNAGVSFVIIRCGYRGSSTGVLVEDPLFRSNIQGARAAGLKVGVYFFTQAVNEVEAVEEASMALQLVQGYGLTYPIFIDTEYTTDRHGRADGLDRATRTAVCNAFCATVQNAGYSAGIYASKAWYNDMLSYGALSGYRIWLAQYASEASFGSRYDLWQFSRRGSVDGIHGAVDMNWSYLGY